MTRQSCTRLLLALGLAVTALAQAQPAQRPALPADHPLVGTWRIDVPKTACHEIYEIRTDGSTHVTSAAQVAEADLALSLQPAASGFYTWVEQVRMQNGKPDCQGQKVEVGQRTTNYIILDAPGKEFLMCAKQDINTCVGPFVRQAGS